MIRFIPRKTVYIGFLLASVAVVDAQSQIATSNSTTDPSAIAVAGCGTTLQDLGALEACAARELFKSAAKTYARIQRFVLIGQLCHKISEEDATAILANGQSELEEARSSVTDKEWAKTWQQAVVIGATQAADVTDAISDEDCDRFARPGGALTKIMSWSGKLQSVDGVLVSPRSRP